MENLDQDTLISVVVFGILDFIGVCVLLAGMMGSGKSSVGRALARHLGWDFIDTDERIEHEAGKFR